MTVPSVVLMTTLFGCVHVGQDSSSVLVHAFVGQTAISFPKVESNHWCHVGGGGGSRPPSTTRLTLKTDSVKEDDEDDEGEDDGDGVLDAHEFEQNQTLRLSNASYVNKLVISKRNITSPSTDPLTTMSNLTDKMASLTRQFQYHVELAQDDQTKLETRLKESQDDRQKLQSLLNQLRHDKEAIQLELRATKLSHSQNLNQTKRQYQRKMNQTQRQFDAQTRQLQQQVNSTKLEYRKKTQRQQEQAQVLISQASQDRKTLKVEQARVLALQHTVDEQEHYIHRTETSTRHLLFLLGKLLLRRIERLILYVFPFVVRLVKGVFGFVTFWFREDDEEEDDGVTQQQQQQPPQDRGDGATKPEAAS